MKVLILFGGKSYEHNISIKSVNFIIKNIDTTIFDYKVAGFTLDNELYEIKNKCVTESWVNDKNLKINNIIEYFKSFDIVFPMIHGNIGEDGKIQSLFEIFNIKYVGCNQHSSLISYDKLLTKLILEKYSIPQIPYIIYNKDLNLKTIKYPVIVKPCMCGSSIGINVANNTHELKKALKIALKYDKNVIIEKFIKNNRELECAILEKKNKLIISDIGEIINNGSWYDYNSKYEKSTKTTISDIDNNIKEKIKNYSKLIFNILGCSKMSRLDFLYDLENNKLYFNEINTIPGFTEISMYPILIKDANINFKDLISSLLLS